MRGAEPGAVDPSPASLIAQRQDAGRAASRQARPRAARRHPEDNMQRDDASIFGELSHARMTGQPPEVQDDETDEVEHEGQRLGGVGGAGRRRAGRWTP